MLRRHRNEPDMYNKIFTKILDSSIWLAPDPHRLVWITLIAAMDKDGFAQFACAENLAARARVSVEDTKSALKAFESPDPFDDTQDHDGRRIERFPGGWLVLNAEKYRSMVSQIVATEQSKLRMQAFRRREALRNVTEPLRPVAPSEADADASSEADAKKRQKTVVEQKLPDPVLAVFEHWQKVWKKSRSKLDPKRRKAITAALRLYDVPTLCLSIDGYQRSDWHKGQNDRHTVYDDIGIFLRDSAHVDAGLKFAEGVPEPRRAKTTEELLAEGYKE
jgi:hypothetical protein